MKKILGLDIGTNSIGWAFIESNVYENPDTLDGRIIQLGSRIIPMDADAMNKFELGTPESKAAGRRQARGARRLNQRYKLRRTRLIEALKILDWIPDDFPINFKKLDKHSINKYLPFSDELKKEANNFFGIADMVGCVITRALLISKLQRTKVESKSQLTKASEQRYASWVQQV